MNPDRCIVDTNVPIVANGDNSDVCYECRFKTVEFLEKLMNSGRLIVDTEGEVEREYWSNLRSGYPGVGNRFIQHFFAAHADRVDRIDLANLGEGKNLEFVGALKNFDRSDQKFARLSKATRKPVYVSVDTDWAIFSEPLAEAEISIEFLCGENQKNWFLQNKQNK